MRLDQIDLIVRDVPAATAFFRDVLGLTPNVAEERFAELVSGSTTIILSPEAMVPTEPAVGIILHFRVEDVAEALERARRAGATVPRATAPTDWGTESAMIGGPERIVVDLYRPLSVSPDA